MPDSKFPWPGSWWTNTGRRDGNDWSIPAGATFVPWANTAVPVGEKLWTIEFTYTAAADVTMAIRHNPFSKADERSQVGQIALRTVTLSKGDQLTLRVNITLAKSDQPLWTPSFLSQGPGEIRFHAIKMYETPTGPETPEAPEASLLPALKSWWRSAGYPSGEGASLPAGASSTPYDSAAISVGDRKFTFEVQYTSGDPNILNIRANKFSDQDNKLDGPFQIKRAELASGKAATVKIEIDIPEDVGPKWLPSLLVDPSGHDILIHSLRMYGTPGTAPRVMVWDGEVAQECVVTVWDGSAERPASIDIVS